MSYILIASGPGFTALADQPVVPREQVRRLADAAALLAEAEARLASVDAVREAARAEARAEGFAAGLAQGREAAAGELVANLAELHHGAAQEREAVRAGMGRLALDIVRRIASELAPEQVIAAIAARAVREVLPEQPIVVRVATTNVGETSARLWPLSASVEVQGDPALGAQDCVLETGQGRTVASLDVQLTALEQAFAAETADERAVA